MLLVLGLSFTALCLGLWVRAVYFSYHACPQRADKITQSVSQKTWCSTGRLLFITSLPSGRTSAHTGNELLLAPCWNAHLLCMVSCSARITISCLLLIFANRDTSKLQGQHQRWQLRLKNSHCIDWRANENIWWFGGPVLINQFVTFS